MMTDDRSPPGALPKSMTNSPSTNKARRRLLIVEDSYFAGLMMEDALTDAGYEIIDVLPTAEQALTVATGELPDLVLMDIRLAGPMDGIDAAIALKGLGITSLFVSAHSDDGIRHRGEAASPAGWLTKPFSEKDVIEAVRAALNQIEK